MVDIKKGPILMTEEYWADSPLSITRYFGHCMFHGNHYIIVDKTGRDIFECSVIAEKEGREKAIEPGEPCDLCREDMIPAYRKLGRDAFIQLLEEGKSAAEINEAAGVESTALKITDLKNTTNEF